MTANDLQNQPKGILEHLVSVFNGAKTTKPVENIALGLVLQLIQSGRFREEIAQVRARLRTEKRPTNGPRSACSPLPRAVPSEPGRRMSPWRTSSSV